MVSQSNVQSHGHVGVSLDIYFSSILDSCEVLRKNFWHYKLDVRSTVCN